jgi:hypothetical protein
MSYQEQVDKSKGTVSAFTSTTKPKPPLKRNGAITKMTVPSVVGVHVHARLFNLAIGAAHLQGLRIS